MIHLDLQIDSGTMNEHAMECLRMELRQRMLGFIFECCDNVATREDMRFNHSNIGVTGEIKVV